MKSLLKFGLVILVLAAVFYMLIAFLDQRKQKSDMQQAETSEQMDGPSIQNIQVLSSNEGAIVQLSDVMEAGYTITQPDPNTLVIDFPTYPLIFAKRMIPIPHPMVELIEAEETEDGKGTRVKLSLVAPASFQDRLIGNTLYLDLVAGDMQDKTEDAQVSEAPAPVTKAPPARRSAPKKRVAKPTAPPAPEPQAPSADDLISELGMNDGADLGSDGQTDAFGSFEGDGFGEAGGVQPDDLALGEQDLGFGEGFDSGFSEGDLGEGDLGGFEQPAAIDPNVVASLPSLSSISVMADKDGSKVTIAHAAGDVLKKVFLKRPDQVVVDIKDVTVEGLNQVSPGAGVRDIKSQQFVGPDGTISRLTFYVSRLPQSRSDVKVMQNKNNQLVLVIP